jgi:putative transcriptional regulator
VGGAGLRTGRGVRGRSRLAGDHLPGAGALGGLGAQYGYLPLQGTLGTVDLEGDPTSMAPWLEELRIFAGYAGWGAGQLDEELAAGAWWALDAEDADVFSDEPSLLWKRVLRRQGGALAVTAAYPPDPSLN